MIDQFDYFVPTHVVFGPGSLRTLHERKLPGKRALIVTTNGGSVKRHGQLDALTAELDAAGVTYHLFDEVSPNPTAKNADDGGARARDLGCDFVVGLGGGSAIDCAKAIAVAATNPGPIWDYVSSATCGGGKSPEHDALPIVAVTTTAGTGTEVDQFSVLLNEETDEKTDIEMPSMFPTLAVVDAELMMTVPPAYTAYQGMDTFFHAAESVINTTEHVVGEMFALKAIELVAANLPRAVACGSDREARANMAIANTLAGYYMLCTTEHTMEHALGSFHPNLPHGAGLIMISHAYFDLFAKRKACEDQMAKMARAMGVAGATGGEDFVAALDKLIDDIGCADLKMSDFGVTREELPRVVEKCRNVSGGDDDANPLPLSDADLLAMFEASYK